MMKLAIGPLVFEAFAPFGTVVQAPAQPARTSFPAALSNLRPDARATLSASHSLPLSLPLTTNVMERHRYSTQTFLPLDVERYVVVVAPHSAEGTPDMRHARAFVVPGDTGISYGADTWHHPMIVLDRPGCFAVLLWRDDTINDIETVTLDHSVVIPAM
jgi:ureidoglycolate lyase